MSCPSCGEEWMHQRDCPTYLLDEEYACYPTYMSDSNKSGSGKDAYGFGSHKGGAKGGQDLKTQGK